MKAGAAARFEVCSCAVAPAKRAHATSPAETSADRPVASVNVRDRPHSVERMNQAGWAEETARKVLEIPLPRRWAHTQGVAAQARTLAPILSTDADLLEAAAWLHDIGYSPDLVVTGFHPLDGARYLRDHEHADELLTRLVAHHSCAAIEAEERGLADELHRDFARPRRDLADALTYCDMTTGPDGQHLAVESRLSEIHRRYGYGHLVSHAIRRASPRIIEAVYEVTATIKHRSAEERTAVGC